MDLSTLLRSSEEELQSALEQSGELRAAVTEDVHVLVRRTENGGYRGDLRVEGNTVVLVQQEEYDRFRQRLKEQIAIHVPRDEQPDLTGP